MTRVESHTISCLGHSFLLLWNFVDYFEFSFFVLKKIVLLCIIKKYCLSRLSCCSLTQSCPTLCDPMVCSTPGLRVPHYLPKFAQVHVHCIVDDLSWCRLNPSHWPEPNILQENCKWNTFQDCSMLLNFVHC